MSKTVAEFREFLLTTGLLRPVTVEVMKPGGHLDATCKLLSKNQESAWLKAVEYLLSVAEGHQINLRLGSRFVLVDGQMVRGWGITLFASSSSEMKKALEVLHVAAVEIAALEFEEPEPEPVVVKPPSEPLPVESELVAGTQEPEPEKEQKPVDVETLKKRQEEFRKHTKATPRSGGMDMDGDAPTPPPGWDPRPRLVFRGTARDQKNRLVKTEIHEVPLPHMYGVSDMNVPNEKDKGAKTIGG